MGWWAWVSFTWDIDSNIYIVLDLLKNEIEVDSANLSRLTLSWYMEWEINVPDCILETLDVKVYLPINENSKNIIKAIKDKVCKEIIEEKKGENEVFNCSDLEELKLEIEIASSNDVIDDILWGGYIRGEMEEWIEINGDTDALWINDVYVIYKTKNMDEERTFNISLEDDKEIIGLLEEIGVIKYNNHELELPEGMWLYITLNKEFVEWYNAIFDNIASTDDVDLLMNEHQDWCNDRK